MRRTEEKGEHEMEEEMKRPNEDEDLYRRLGFAYFMTFYLLPSFITLNSFLIRHAWVTHLCTKVYCEKNKK